MKVFNHKETEFIMINIPEILVANGTGAFLVLFLLLYRIRIAQTNQFDEKAYNFMLIVTFIATINETLSFIIDARPGFINDARQVDRRYHFEFLNAKENVTFH